MSRPRPLALVLSSLALTAPLLAQQPLPPAGPAQPAPGTVQPPPPPQQPGPAQPVPPQPTPTAAPPGDAPRPGPRPVELFVLMGPGSAFCDDKKPDSDCPVEGGGASFGLGGGWRFHRRFSANLELSAWSFKVRDAWKGKLDDPATDVKFGSSYLALIGRWYFFAGESADAYVGFGVGVGSVKATAKNAGGKYEFEAKGVAYPASVGVEWRLAPWFRLGPQGLIYLHKTTQVCETINGGTEQCRSESGGDKNALPWRIAAVGTFLLGGQ